MIKKYSGKAKKLLKNPQKIKHVPSFLRQEFTVWRGSKKASLGDISARFVVNNLSEYNRVNSFKNEEDIIQEIIAELSKDDVFYDIGANIGTHSVLAGKTGAKVYSFEPFPKNADSLRKNFELNDINGYVFEIALMNENSEMGLNKESGEAGEGKVNISDDGDVKTEVYRGDKLIEEKALESPNVMKIDIEGAEFEALKGLKETLESGKLRVIFIEIHTSSLEDFGGSKGQLKDFIRENGFKIVKLGERGSEHHIKAVKRN